MATDATGTPTSPDNIPKLNTAVDAPSGKAHNEAADAIQTALSARVGSPAGILTGEVPVWNGSTWVRSSATKIGTGSLTGYPWANADIAAAAAIAVTKLAAGSNTQILTTVAGVPTWSAPAASGPTWTLGASPPGSPNNGDIWVLDLNATQGGTYWMFVYDNTQATYKWRFVGGGVLSAQGTATATNVMSTLATITFPRNGDYYVTGGVDKSTTSGGATSQIVAGGTTQTSQLDSGGSWNWEIEATAVTNVQTATIQSRIVNGGTSHGYVSIVPVRVS